MAKLILLIILVAGAGLFLARYALPNLNSDELQTIDLTGLSASPGEELQPGAVENETINAVSAEAAQRGLTQADIDGIRAALAARFGLSIQEVEITLGNDSTAEFATGRVNIGEGDQGGIYFAAKTEKGWEIAHDGRGVVECQPIEEYSIPAGFVPRCYDPATGLSVDR